MTIAISYPIPVMTVHQFAEHLGVSVRTVERRIANGEIPTMPKGSPREIPLINLAKYWQQALSQPY